MKIERMKRQTLLNVIKKCHLEISSKHSVADLRSEVARLIPTYIEDHFLRRVRTDLFPRGYRLPGRNICHLQPTALEFDFSWKSLKVAIEIHGGLSNARSGHRSCEGVKRDMHKTNLAQLHGWILLQLTTEQVMEDLLWSKHTLPMILKALSRETIF